MKSPFGLGPRPGLVLGVVAVLLGLGVFYWFQTAQNRAQLNQRNLRDLARIARGIEAKTNNLEEIVAGQRAPDGCSDTVARLVPHAIRSCGMVGAGGSGDGSGGGSGGSGPDGTGAGAAATCRTPPAGAVVVESALWLHANGTSACVARRVRADPHSLLVVEFDLVGLLGPAMTSSFFEEVFLADRHDRVFIQPGSTGQRLRSVPEPAARDDGEAEERSRNTDAYRARIGGREFRVFVQPVDLRIPGPRASASEDEAAGGGSIRWQVGGLVDAGRYRSESLSLDTVELSILLLLVILTVLAWPFLKLWSMGEREAVASRDLLFLGFSFVLGSGLVAICVFDLAFYWQLRDAFDGQLAEVGEEMARNVHREVGFALEELDTLGARFHASVTGEPQRTRLVSALRTTGAECPVPIADGEGEAAGPGAAAREVYGCLSGMGASALSRTAPAPAGDRDGLRGEPLIRERACRSGSEADGPGCETSVGRLGTRFPYFQMAIWVNPEGFQVAKWSLDDAVTARRSVAHREYVRRVRTGDLWRWSELESPDPGAAGTRVRPREVEYFLEVVRSINTGEILIVLSTPYDPWRAEGGSGATGGRSVPSRGPPPGLEGWAATMTTKLASLDRPVLPPGFGFAVIDGDGRVLSHSLTERALEANFFEETDQDAALRSIVMARAESHRTLRYLGRDIRLFVTPIRGTPLSLVAYQDWAYPGTIAFESLAVALILFGGFVLLLLALAVGVHLTFPYHLGWAWPGVWLDGRHRVLLMIFALLAAGGVIQALEIGDATAVDQYMVHMLAGTYLLAILAVAATLLVPARRPGQTVLGVALAAVAGGILVEAARHLELGRWGFVPEHPLLLAPLLSAVVAAGLFYSWFARRASFAPWLSGPRWLERNMYPVTMLAGLLVVGTLPAALSFAIIGADHVELLVKHNQLHVVEELDRRETRLRAEYGPSAELGARTSPILLARRDGLGRVGSAAPDDATALDVIVSPAFETCYKLPDPDRPETEPPDWRCGVGSDETPAVHSWTMPEGSIHDPVLHLIMDRFLPYFTEVSVRTRHLYHDHAASPHEIGDGHDSPSEASQRIALASVGGVPATGHEFDRGWWWSVHVDHPTIDSLFPVAESALRVSLDGPEAAADESRRMLLDYRPRGVSGWRTVTLSWGDRSHTLSELSPRTTYELRLRLCADGGEPECYAWSSIQTGSTATGPGASPSRPNAEANPFDPDRAGTARTHGQEAEDERGHPILLSVGPPRRNYAAFSRLPEGFGIPGGVRWWAVLLGGLAALFYLIRYISRKVFLSDCHPTEAVTVRELAEGDLDHPTLIVTPWKGDRAVLRNARDDVVAIDLREVRRRSGDGPIDIGLPPRDRLLAIDGLDEVLDDPGWSEHLLDWLEELHTSDRRMVLLADRDPAKMLYRNGADAPGRTGDSGGADAGAGEEGASTPAGLPKNRERWVRLFSSFTRVFAGRPEPAQPNAPRREVSFAFGDLWKARPNRDRKERNEWLLERECGVTAALRPVEDHVRRHPEFGRLSDDALIGLLKDASAGQYERVWDAISDEERMTLAQIAHGAVSVPKRRRAVTHLLSLGLLDRRPGLELMNRSFRDFVRDAASPARVAAWEKAGDASVWQAVRQPLLITLVAIALFLFVTQRDLFNTGIAFVTAAAAGVPSLFRLLGAVRTSRQES